MTVGQIARKADRVTSPVYFIQKESLLLNLAEWVWMRKRALLWRLHVSEVQKMQPNVHCLENEENESTYQSSSTCIPRFFLFLLSSRTNHPQRELGANTHQVRLADCRSILHLTWWYKSSCSEACHLQVCKTRTVLVPSKILRDNSTCCDSWKW